MKTLVYCQSEEMLDGFKFGFDAARSGAKYTQSVDVRGYWLLIEDYRDGDNATCDLSQDNGLVFESTGVEV